MSKYSLAIVIAALTLSGCQQTSPPPTVPAAPPYSMEKFNQLRAEYQQTNPDVRVGLVGDVIAGDRLLTLTNVQADDFKVGDLVSFWDSNNKLLTSGKVVGTHNGIVSAHYADPQAGGRAPAKGDLAIGVIRAAQ